MARLTVSASGELPLITTEFTARGAHTEPPSK
jgi:hypothetical protein